MDYRHTQRMPWRIRLASLLLMGSISVANASPIEGGSKIFSINAVDKSVENVLEEIEAKSDYNFFYDNEQINTSQVVSVKSDGSDIFKLLDEVFKNTNITYKVLDKNIILSVKSNNFRGAGSSIASNLKNTYLELYWIRTEYRSLVPML